MTQGIQSVQNDHQVIDGFLRLVSWGDETTRYERDNRAFLFVPCDRNYILMPCHVGDPANAQSDAFIWSRAFDAEPGLLYWGTCEQAEFEALLTKFGALGFVQCCVGANLRLWHSRFITRFRTSS